ncbi:MAG: STAS domain-containing protein [Hyphomicrobium sp.]|uniref:STAS domain-containing protein n=1 Tax=Hyphomicrobium sp. TaxID=82 RepID=UPI0039E4C2A3
MPRMRSRRRSWPGVRLGWRCRRHRQLWSFRKRSNSSSAGGIKDQLLARRGSPLVVDAGQVRRTGMQALQLLIAAARSWQADGQEYVVANPTSEFLDTLALVGLSREHLLVEGHIG